MWMRRPVSSCVDLHRQEKRRRIETLDRQVLPKIITLFERRGDAIDTPKEPEILRTICERMPHLNFSRDLLAHVPGDTAVMEMKGVWWSDWGSLDRIVETLMRLGAGSRALVEHLRAAAMEDRAARMSEGLWVVMKRMKQRLCRSTACMAVLAWVCERTSLARGVLPHSEEALCRKWQQSAGASPLSARWNKVMSPASRPSRAREKLAFLLLGPSGISHSLPVSRVAAAKQDHRLLARRGGSQVVERSAARTGSIAQPFHRSVYDDAIGDKDPVRDRFFG